MTNDIRDLSDLRKRLVPVGRPRLFRWLKLASLRLFSTFWDLLMANSSADSSARNDIRATIGSSGLHMRDELKKRARRIQFARIEPFQTSRHRDSNCDLEFCSFDSFRCRAQVNFNRIQLPPALSRPSPTTGLRPTSATKRRLGAPGLAFSN